MPSFQLELKGFSFLSTTNYFSSSRRSTAWGGRSDSPTALPWTSPWGQRGSHQNRQQLSFAGTSTIRSPIFCKNLEQASRPSLSAPRLALPDWGRGSAWRRCWRPATMDFCWEILWHRNRDWRRGRAEGEIRFIETLISSLIFWGFAPRSHQDRSRPSCVTVSSRCPKPV